MLPDRSLILNRNQQPLRKFECARGIFNFKHHTLGTLFHEILQNNKDL